MLSHRMFSLLASIKRMCSHLFNRGSKKDTVRSPFPTRHVFSLSIPTPSAPPLPDYDFCPSNSLLAAMGEGVVFSVANPLDLHNAVTTVLVVDVDRPIFPAYSVLWFRFDPVSLTTRGVSACLLSSDDWADIAALEIDSPRICGWVSERLPHRLSVAAQSR
jgi:hypothetical protein